MDRLSALIVLVALGAACNDKRGDAPPPSRTNGAKVATKQTDTAAFCDAKHGDGAPAFVTPPLAGDATLPAPAAKWRWVNVWATWCKPCVEEMPRLLAWQGKLAATTPIELAFVSVDESDDDIAAFRKLHPETPPSVRLANPEAQGAWLTQLGLDAGAPIPVHVFVDPAGRVRCVRSGGVREQDFAMIEALLAGK